MKKRFGPKQLLYVLLVTSFLSAGAQNSAPQHKQFSKTTADWLIDTLDHRARIEKSKNGKDIVMTNGLVERTFRLSPNIACISLLNLSSGQQLLRAISPEASIGIDNKVYHVGGLYGQPEKAYLLDEWPDLLHADPNDFQFEAYRITDIPEYIHWKSRAWITNKKSG